MGARKPSLWLPGFGTEDADSGKMDIYEYFFLEVTEGC